MACGRSSSKVAMPKLRTKPVMNKTKSNHYPQSIEPRRFCESNNSEPKSSRLWRFISQCGAEASPHPNFFELPSARQPLHLSPRPAPHSMLSESFIAAIGAPNPSSKSKSTPTPALRDATIIEYALAPLPAPKQIFKKSAASQNCLSLSVEHFFVAQDGKAVVNVYSRERGNQEALVPLQERVKSLETACDGAVVIMGMEGGGLLLWEVCNICGNDGHVN